MKRTMKPKVILQYLTLPLVALVLSVCLAACGKRKDEDHHRQAVEEARRKLSEMVKADQEAAEKRAQEQQEQAEAARRKAQEEERSRAEARRQKEEEDARRREESMKAAEAQEQQEYDEILQELAQLNLRPQVYLSHSLRETGASIEYRGQDVGVIQGYYDQKDWMGLVNCLTADNHEGNGDRPSISSARKALRELTSERRFFVVIRFQDPLPPDERVRFFVLGSTLEGGKLVSLSWGGVHSERVYVSTQVEGTFVVSTWRWRHGAQYGLDKHPDGIGYTYEWDPEELANTDILVMLSDKTQKLDRTVFDSRVSAEEAESRLVTKRRRNPKVS